MANDNLIQKVINELNYEIIQLKYKNETNVTMRIDSIIEFLEGVKDDVIGAQGDQKFDLARTATNCTITVLDEDNEPITDGSNKLSYGDVIKISVVASAGYENPTLSVNGLSFVSGNTMEVKSNIAIVGSATAVSAQTEPFEVDDVLGEGSKIHFDTSKGSELDTYLAGITYQDGFAVLIGGTSDFSIQAFDMNVLGQGGAGSGYLLMTSQGSGTVLYASEAGSQEEISWSAGFQNLDANGDLTLTSDTTIETVNDTTPPSWNGIIISKGEVVAPAEPEEPEEDNSFAVGDVIANGDKIHFDTTANMVSDFYSQLTYTQSASGDYIVLLQSETYSHLYIQAISSGGEYFLMGYVGGNMIPIHATTATTLSGITFAGGWESVDANGDITLSSMSEGETLITVASGDWNGTIISKGSAVVNPTLTPFASNDIIASGDKIHCDTSKASEFATYLSGLTYQDTTAMLMDYGSSGGNAILSANKDESTGDIVVLILSTNSGIGAEVLFATASGSIEAEGTSLSWNAGFNNLDANGDYTLALPASITVYSVYDTTPSTWNGVIIGKGDTASPQ